MEVIAQGVSHSLLQKLINKLYTSAFLSYVHALHCVVFKAIVRFYELLFAFSSKYRIGLCMPDNFRSIFVIVSVFTQVIRITRISLAVTVSTFTHPPTL